MNRAKIDSSSNAPPADTGVEASPDVRIGSPSSATVHPTNFVKFANLVDSPINKFGKFGQSKSRQPVSDAVSTGLNRERSGHRPVGSSLTATEAAMLQVVGDATYKEQTLVDLAQTVRPGITERSAQRIVANLGRGLRDVMDECGLTDKALILQYLKPALEATETCFFPMPNEDDPYHIEERTKKAWNPRIRSLDFAFRLRGDYAPTRSNVDVSGKVEIADKVRGARHRAAAGVRVLTEVAIDAGQQTVKVEASSLAQDEDQT